MLQLDTRPRAGVLRLPFRPVFPENGNSLSAPEQPEELPFSVLVQNYYKKRFQTDMDEETLSLLLEIMEESEETI